MTTYGGRSASYVPGREVVNKEPPVSKYVVEKLYRVHRERVLKVEPTIDSYVKIPDFLVNQTWKKNAEKQKLVVIARENQDIYGRIAKVENSEGQITKENKVHVKRVEAKLAYLRKLKEHGRLVQMIKIQKENELFLKRLEKANPQYTLKNCQEWYRHHERFKTGRRVDPTAGHIMHNMKGLLPGSLPPISASLTTYDRTESLTGAYKKKLPGLGTAPPILQSSSNSMLSSIASESKLEGSEMMSPFQDLNSQDSSRKPVKKSSSANSGNRSRGGGDDSTLRSGQRSRASEFEAKILESEKEDASEYQYEYDLESDNESQHSQESTSEELMLLSSRPFAIPFDSKNCLVQVYIPRIYDENIRFRVVSSGINPQRLAERILPIDRAYEIINAAGQSSQIVHSTDNEDLQSLSTMLINMFKEADDDGSGALTFDEFQKLMEQVELGISAQELRFVISEADENENGVVDYEEFVPLAVDLIQSFRARNRAKTMNSQEDVLVDDQILQTISSAELKRAAEKCLEKVYEFDAKRYGLIRVPDLKKCLNQVAATVGIADNEISMLCQMLPRDQFGRIKYNATPTTLYDCLSKVRFMTMKNAIIESQGSGLQKYLLDLCKEEEKKLANYNTSSKEKFVPTGIIPCRSLISILSNSPRLSLSRLQVLVIMSEASVLDGMINYFQFVPVVAKAIEIMFEPKALRQRAELIEKTDLSPEALLQGMSSELFEQRLLTLFKSYDIDHNGTLDQNEFIACLESLDLQLSYGEMVALMAAADVAQHGFLKFEDFVGFFTHNLLSLEREKHIRLLQNSLHNSMKKGTHKAEVEDKHGKIVSAEEDLTSRLLALFRLSDPNNTGHIPFDDFETILQNLSINVSKFLIDVLVSELHVNDDGLVEYEKSLVTCTELFRVYKAKETVMEENKVREKQAEEKAVKITEACSDEIHQIVRYLTKKFKYINEHPTLSPIAKYLEVQETIRSPNSGLSRNESNMILTKLFIGINDNRIHNALKATSNEEGTPATYPAPTAAAAAAAAAAVGGHGGSSSTSAAAAHYGNIPIPSSLNLTLEYTPVRNNLHTPKFRNSIKSIKFQFSTQELFQAIFEAKKITIMRSLLQEIDIDNTQQQILQRLQQELLKRQHNNEISPDSTFLPASACYQILENLHELRLNRAQIMFLISLADCYDRDGKLLEIYRFAEHASSIISQLNDSDVLETRAEVMNTTVIDDRKTFQGLREREFIEELTQHIQHHIEKRKQIVKDLLNNHQIYVLNHSGNHTVHHNHAQGLQQISIQESKDEDYEEDVEQYANEESQKHIIGMIAEEDRQLHSGKSAGHHVESEETAHVEEKILDENEKKLQFLSRLDDYTIGKEELYEILRTLPRNKFSDREITTIISGIRIPVRGETSRIRASSDSLSSGTLLDDDDEFLSVRASMSSIEVAVIDIIPWRELLNPLVEAVRSLQREHIIHRRVTLIASSMNYQPQSVPPAPSGDSVTTGNNSETTSVAKQKLQDDSMRTLKQLAEKLLNFVKIVTAGDGGIAIQLPIDANTSTVLRRTSSQILSKDELLSVEDLHHTQISTLYRCAAFIKMITTRTSPIIINTPVAVEKIGFGRKYTARDVAPAVGSTPTFASSINLLGSNSGTLANSSSNNLNTQLGRSSSMLVTSGTTPVSSGNPNQRQNSPNRSSAMFGSGNGLLDLVTSAENFQTECIKEEKVAMFIQILSIEDTRYYSGCNLIANFVSADSSFNACETIAVKLPTIGLVDHDAAQQFAANLVERMYFEMDEKEKKPTLKMNEI